MINSKPQKFARREFIKRAAGGAALGAGAVAGAVSLPSAADAPQPTQTRRGYRETPHIREYYKLARF